MKLNTPDQSRPPVLPINERNKVEAALWQAFKSGDQASFALIYQKFFPCLYSYGLKIGAEQDVIQDAIQDLFVYLWNHRTTLADTTSIKYYLWTALRRRIAKASNALPDTLVSDAVVTLAVESSAEAVMITEEISKERKEHLLAAMQALTKRQREAVHLKFYHNLKNEEIAQRMSIRVEAVYNLISKSLVVLKKSYQRVSTLVLLSYFFPF